MCAAPEIRCHHPTRLIWRSLLLFGGFWTMPAAGISRTFTIGSSATLLVCSEEAWCCSSQTLQLSPIRGHSLRWERTDKLWVCSRCRRRSCGDLYCPIPAGSRWFSAASSSHPHPPGLRADAGGGGRCCCGQMSRVWLTLQEEKKRRSTTPAVRVERQGGGELKGGGMQTERLAWCNAL